MTTDFQVLGVTTIVSLWLLWKVYSTCLRRKSHSLRSVAILVLGDIGRSPRMMYHAESFAELGFMTFLIGYGGSKPIPALERLPKVQLRHLPEPPAVLKSIPFILAAPFKILHQITAILAELLVNIPEAPEYIMVQNPPSIPTLALVAIVGGLRGSKIIIDWHNTGWSILALKLRESHPFVQIAKWFEATFGRQAFAHLFVTEAMKEALVEEWDLQGTKVVLHDRPPRHFHRSSPQEKHDLFMRLRPELVKYRSLLSFLPKFDAPYSTPFTDTSSNPSTTQLTFPEPVSPETAISASTNTYAHDKDHPIPLNVSTYELVNPPTLRPDRPALVVSSTSWTPDEDFGILLDALKVYEARACEVNSRDDDGEKLPKVLVVVTGKGPERERYMNEVKELEKEWQWVRCISLWLEAEDYPVFLGSADLGVCLHTSSSQLDLPMKVVDMFGCGVPVCALNFKCLPELVKHEQNGLTFENAGQLSDQLESLLLSFPRAPRLAALKASLEQATVKSHPPQRTKDVAWTWCSWDVNWDATLKPIVMQGIRT
ncbi:mannosyltransferase [Marasmius crinis-equi]|uniref:Chitobiosyldiphosphodolichol beta-mannosyltransferase n=1 Tax=Marasmius crinis-equi TaxID=585013 RepID=A0ABR3FM30_9AGAR